MIYMGSKARYAKYIVPILQKTIDDNNVKTYIECFCGGCNIIDKIKCKNKYAYDRSDTLIALLEQSAEDFDKIPTDGNREQWDKGKGYVKDGVMPSDMTLAEIGAIEFLGSYSNGGFPLGFARNTPGRNYYVEAYNNLKAQAPNLQGIKFKCQNYWDLDENIQDAVIYLDPPYQGTKKYGYSNQPKMDYTHFWNWVRKISKKNYVFISEQNAPEDFDVIWYKDVKRTTCRKNDFQTTEKLFKLHYEEKTLIGPVFDLDAFADLLTESRYYGDKIKVYGSNNILKKIPLKPAVSSKNMLYVSLQEGIVTFHPDDIIVLFDTSREGYDENKLEITTYNSKITYEIE